MLAGEEPDDEAEGEHHHQTKVALEAGVAHEQVAGARLREAGEQELWVSWAGLGWEARVVLVLLVLAAWAMVRFYWVLTAVCLALGAFLLAMSEARTARIYLFI